MSHGSNAKSDVLIFISQFLFNNVSASVVDLSHYTNTPMQYTAIFHRCKNVHFQLKLKGSSNEYLCFGEKIRKKVFPCKPQFYYIKVGCKGVFVTRTCFRDLLKLYQNQ